jgi:predicted HicB family RNase H-like nuclease
VAKPTKPKKMGRPKLASGEAKGRIVPVRFRAGDLKAIAAAAKKNDQSVSEWIRSTLHAAVQEGKA